MLKDKRGMKMQINGSLVKLEWIKTKKVHKVVAVVEIIAY